MKVINLSYEHKWFFIYVLIASFRIGFGQEEKNYLPPDVFDTIVNTNVEPFYHVNWQEAFRNRNFLTFKGDYSPSSTSFFINKNFILTAGHNLKTDFLSRIDWLKVIPGKYKDDHASDEFKINGRKKLNKHKRLHPKFSFLKKSTKRIKWDYALVYIPDDYLDAKLRNNANQFFELDASYKLKEGDKIFIAGYPADGENKGKYYGDLMIYQVGTVQNINGNIFYHNFYTEKGNSGSPVWVEKDGRRIVVGIHTFPNKATYLNSENIKIIKDWMNGFLQEHDLGDR